MLDHQIARYVAVGQRVTANYPQATCSFISGSLVEGMGNARSDLDLFVLTTAGDSRASDDVTSFQLADARVDIAYTENLRVDTEIWSLEAVRTAAAEFRDIAPDDRAAMICVSQDRLELAHRIRIGVPVKNELIFTEVHQLFDYNKLSLILANISLSRYQGSAEDAAGSINDKDGGTALLTSRSALGAAVDAFLAANGDTNPKFKWRTRKLQRMDEQEMLSEYLREEAQGEIDEASLLSRAKGRLRLASQIALRTQRKLAETQ